MKTFNLTFNPDDIRDIYQLDRLNKERKSFKTFVPLLGALGAIITALYWFFNDSVRNKEFTILIACAFAFYMVRTFWKARKKYADHILEVEKFIAKNVAYKRMVVSIDDYFLQLELDDSLSKHSLKEVLNVHLEDKYMSFKFKEDSIMFPKSSFKPGEWDEFIQTIRSADLKK